VFPSWLKRQGESRPVTLRCRPAARDDGRTSIRMLRGGSTGIGYLRITTPAGADELSGHFLVELATCENVESGKTLDWPAAPLTVRGSFSRLPHRVG
jgi:hypothetical protein